ncbi:MAG TPA: hypothetical protein VHD56_01115 [Tepidisphaeraceae bacterium]|nr:hypothetical protein [Tepidisphaeraceae bacterium]
MSPFKYILTAILLLPFSLISLGQSSSQPSTRPNNEAWKLFIVHPSMDKDKLYRCIVTIPIQYPINENLGFTPVLVDRSKELVGTVPLHLGNVIDAAHWVECRLNQRLIKNSYIVFQLNPNTDNVRLIKLMFGEQETFRKVGEEIIHEPIE